MCLIDASDKIANPPAAMGFAQGQPWLRADTRKRAVARSWLYLSSRLFIDRAPS